MICGKRNDLAYRLESTFLIFNILYILYFIFSGSSNLSLDDGVVFPMYEDDLPPPQSFMKKTLPPTQCGRNLVNTVVPSANKTQQTVKLATLKMASCDTETADCETSALPAANCDPGATPTANYISPLTQPGCS